MAYDTDGARDAWSARWGITVERAMGGCKTRRLTGHPCRAAKGEHGCCLSPPAVFDHVYSITRQSDGHRGILSMPYGFDSSDASELSAWCYARAAEWEVLGDGWHYPGTVAVVIYPLSAPGETP